MKKEQQPHNQASAWFDEVYEKNRESHDSIPWARQAVNPLLESYLNDNQTHQGKALVIGCGLGDDAKALEEAGYEVVAIDVAQSALDLAQERFPNSTIQFEKQDIFDMPEKYHEHFDFVFEAFTIQSLPVEFRAKMIEAVANTVVPKGRLLVVAHKRDHQFDGPPWPLEEIEVAMFQEYGLKELTFELHKEKSPISPHRFRVMYEK